MTLFEIADDLKALSELLDETGGEITPDTEGAIEAWFAEVGQDQAAKLDGYCYYLQKLESEAAVARATADQFRQKVSVREKAAARLKDRLKGFLESTGQKKVTTASGWEIAVRKNGGKPSLDIDHDAPIPEEFFVQPPPVLDKDKVREALAAGAKLPFVKIVEPGTHLRIS